MFRKKVENNSTVSQVSCTRNQYDPYLIRKIAMQSLPHAARIEFDHSSTCLSCLVGKVYTDKNLYNKIRNTIKNLSMVCYYFYQAMDLLMIDHLNKRCFDFFSYFNGNLDAAYCFAKKNSDYLETIYIEDSATLWNKTFSLRFLSDIRFNIKNLYLLHSNITEAQTIWRGQFDKLRSLSLNCSKLESRDLVRIGIQSPNLKKMTVVEYRYNNLSKIIKKYFPNLNELNCISKLSSLDWIVMCRVTFEKITTLNINKEINDFYLGQILLCFPNLETLDFSGEITFDLLSLEFKIPQLICTKNLILYDTKITESGFNQIVNLFPNLEILCLQGGANLSGNISTTAIKSLSTMQKLKQFGICVQSEKKCNLIEKCFLGWRYNTAYFFTPDMHENFPEAIPQKFGFKYKDDFFINSSQWLQYDFGFYRRISNSCCYINPSFSMDDSPRHCM